MEMELLQYDSDPWNWHVVLSFVHHYHRRTIEEKIKFIEKGYSEASCGCYDNEVEVWIDRNEMINGDG